MNSGIKQIKAQAKLNGTTNQYQAPHYPRRFHISNNLNNLAEATGAFWLLDAIADWQEHFIWSQGIQRSQTWTLTVEGDSAYLVGTNQAGAAIAHQAFASTTYPLAEETIWVKPQTIRNGPELIPILLAMLPDEYRKPAIKVDPRLAPTVAELEGKIDAATKTQLCQYDDGRKWLFICESNLDLAEVAWATINAPEQIVPLIDDGQLQWANSIHALKLPEDLICICFGDAYLLKANN